MEKFSNSEIVTLYWEADFNKTKLAKKMGISVQSLLTTYISNRVGLKDAMVAAEEARLDAAEERLFELVRANNFPAIKFLLSTKGKDRGYGDSIAVTNTDNGAEILAALNRKYGDDL